MKQVGGEKASLRQQRSELEDKHAEMVARENKLRDLDAKVKTHSLNLSYRRWCVR